MNLVEIQSIEIVRIELILIREEKRTLDVPYFKMRGFKKG